MRAELDVTTVSMMMVMLCFSKLLVMQPTVLCWTAKGAYRKHSREPMAFQGELNLEATELRLGLPGTPAPAPAGVRKNNKRGLPELQDDPCEESTRPAKTQVVGWPPIRSYRKNCLQQRKTESESGGVYVKVSMDGVPYLRKIDLKLYKGYPQLLKDLEDMFKFKAVNFSSFILQYVCHFLQEAEDHEGVRAMRKRFAFKAKRYLQNHQQEYLVLVLT
ncbi:hypothetical protein SAY87_028124 [Trapa incisa]|uniref:Auxin-responsive protein n=1 Tax=Trapa incisa TaxID=236973 RepID=A0AAN7QRR7_9MYRT|nr:hypothetical protein SAY87_028124 [Trapa incisa]